MTRRLASQIALLAISLLPHPAKADETSDPLRILVPDAAFRNADTIKGITYKLTLWPLVSPRSAQGRAFLLGSAPVRIADSETAEGLLQSKVGWKHADRLQDPTWDDARRIWTDLDRVINFPASPDFVTQLLFPTGAGANPATALYIVPQKPVLHVFSSPTGGFEVWIPNDNHTLIVETPRQAWEITGSTENSFTSTALTHKQELVNQGAAKDEVKLECPFEFSRALKSNPKGLPRLFLQDASEPAGGIVGWTRPAGNLAGTPPKDGTKNAKDLTNDPGRVPAFLWLPANPGGNAVATGSIRRAFLGGGDDFNRLIQLSPDRFKRLKSAAYHAKVVPGGGDKPREPFDPGSDNQLFGVDTEFASWKRPELRCAPQNRYQQLWWTKVPSSQQTPIDLIGPAQEFYQFGKLEVQPNVQWRVDRWLPEALVTSKFGQGSGERRFILLSSPLTWTLVAEKEFTVQDLYDLNHEWGESGESARTKIASALKKPGDDIPMSDDARKAKEANDQKELESSLRLWTSLSKLIDRVAIKRASLGPESKVERAYAARVSAWWAEAERSDGLLRRYARLMEPAIVRHFEIRALKRLGAITGAAEDVKLAAYRDLTECEPVITKAALDLRWLEATTAADDLSNWPAVFISSAKAAKLCEELNQPESGGSPRLQFKSAISGISVELPDSRVRPDPPVSPLGGAQMLQSASSPDDQYPIGHGTFYGLFSNVSEWWRTDKLVTGVGGNWRSNNVKSILASDRAFTDTIGFRLAIRTEPPPKTTQEAASSKPTTAPEAATGKRETAYNEDYARWYGTLFGAEGPAEFKKVMALGDDEYWDLAYIRQVVLAGADDSMLGTPGQASRSLEALPDNATKALLSELLKEPPPPKPE